MKTFFIIIEVTPLHLACRRLSIESVKLLYKKEGIELDALATFRESLGTNRTADSYTVTPIQLAEGCKEIQDILLGINDEEDKDKDKETTE